MLLPTTDVGQDAPTLRDLHSDALVTIGSLPADEQSWAARHFDWDGIPDDEAEDASDAWRNEIDAMSRLDDTALLDVLRRTDDSCRIEDDLRNAAARHVLADRLAAAMHAA